MEIQRQSYLKYLGYTVFVLGLNLLSMSSSAQAVTNEFQIVGLSAHFGKQMPLESIEVYKGQYRIEGKLIKPDKIQFNISIYNFAEGKVDSASITGEVLLPILTRNQYSDPSRLIRKDFYSVEINSFSALERWRAVSAAGGIELMPTTEELIERVARSLAQFEVPDLSDVSGNHLYRKLIQPIFSTDAFAHLATRVSEMSNRKVRIEDENGVRPDMRGLLKGHPFGFNLESYFLVFGSERRKLNFGDRQPITGALNLMPVTFSYSPSFSGPKLCSHIFTSK